ncbi:hypothetical protein PRCB_03075 [Pantoea rodasii]|uniref:DUF2635 domain-containing protein n=1 Tax=Pantoea rodasii TaxID=1076549 RepID=A0A2M9WHH2_9GAMM|nr:hypothetical protein [Pantoea rodasii]ORM59600.1 hypothetical protein HA45_22540 [Pantoea rodasii]PJZ07010.1 hypothetical protein PRCB_03075 [Pantoea rodasii]
MQTVKVIARKGVRVPLENSSREYITDAAAVNVVLSAYYRRRIKDGDLQLAPTTTAKAVKTDSDEPVVQRVAEAAASTTTKKES